MEKILSEKQSYRHSAKAVMSALLQQTFMDNPHGHSGSPQQTLENILCIYLSAPMALKLFLDPDLVMSGEREWFNSWQLLRIMHPSDKEQQQQTFKKCFHATRQIVAKFQNAIEAVALTCQEKRMDKVQERCLAESLIYGDRGCYG